MRDESLRFRSRGEAFIPHPSSLILHPAQMNRCASGHVAKHSSLIPHPSSLADESLRFRSRGEAFIPHPSSFIPRIQCSAAMNPLQRVSVAQYGIGPIGAEIARLLLTKPWVKFVAAVDIDPKKIGKDVSEVIGLDKPVGVKVTPDVQGKPEVVCHSTGSRLRDVASQLKELLERGCHVVSTCEELSFPLDQTIRADLQQTARANNVTLLGTGVNPGFVMDKLPLTVTSVCQRIDAIQIVRIQN